jgi:diguanylate cyclase (GGDEF)-like protein/PAS domain S-box-containing protein
MRGEEPAPFEGKLGPKGGPHRDVVVHAKRVTAADGELLGAVVSLTDVTAERTALRALSAERAAWAEAQRVGQIGRYAGTGEERVVVSTTEARTFFEAALVAVPDYTVITDLDSGAVLYGTPGKTILGRTSEQLQALGSDAIAALVHPDDQLRMRALDVAAGDLEDGQVLQLHYRALHADGAWRWLARRVTAFRRDPSGRVTQVLGVIRDVTDVVQAEDRLRHTALHDGLTGLPNRALLHDRLGEALVRAREAGEELAVVFLDLDGFKRINDGYGHSTGDEVLRVTAERLRGALRQQDTVARVGGDEFVVLVEQSHRLVRDVADPSDVPADERLSMRAYGSLVASRLIAAGPDHPDAGAEHRTADAVLRDADAAMYDAKDRGKDQFVVFPEALAGV